MALTESYAAAILGTAIQEGRAAELLDCLWEGGSCTLDNGELVLVTGDSLQQLATNPQPSTSTQGDR